MTKRGILIWAAFCAFAQLGWADGSSGESRTVRCGTFEQAYLAYSPDKNMALPVVVVLHGAGDRPENMFEAWKDLARKQKIVLLVPDLPRKREYEDVAPAAFRCVVEDARKSFQIDPTRVYVFGNSMGGYLTYDAAMFQSEYFAAVAVHGMQLSSEYAGIVKKAKRKTPIAIYIGDHDQFSSIDDLHKTRDLLRKAGFPVHYVELINHDHNYYAISDEINADAWKFLKEQRLPN